MIAVIDNYDSFTYNLVQYLGELGAEPRVFRNDCVTMEELQALEPSHVVVSPGPGTPDEARRQLASFSGGQVIFLSAFSLRRLEDGFRHEGIVETEVLFRELTDGEIRRYVERDRPVDCAGGFRSEATGSALLQAMTSSDPTAIIGLPLIAVSEGLREAGFGVP